MFICQACQRQVPAQIAPQTKIIETRPKTYPARYEIHRPKGHQQKEQRIKIDNGGTGLEIVQEIKVCPDCADKS